MAKRKVIAIDQDKCNGCALCLPNCPEGAIQIIDRKARLISDLFCDGLGACIGYCPQGAITVEHREAEDYDEDKVMVNIVQQGPNVIKAHLKHLKEHNQLAYLKQAMDFLKKNKIDVTLEFGGSQPLAPAAGCPGLKSLDLGRGRVAQDSGINQHQESELGQWPVQLHLVPLQASYFTDAQLLIAADCVPFAYADFHQGLLKGKTLLVGCPKFDDLSVYQEKLEQIFRKNSIKSVTYAHMQVPCCLGLLPVIKAAINNSGKDITFQDVTITIRGEKI